VGEATGDVATAGRLHMPVRAAKRSHGQGER
jgi:hypothetical protein